MSNRMALKNDVTGKMNGLIGSMGKRGTKECKATFTLPHEVTNAVHSIIIAKGRQGPKQLPILLEIANV